MDNIQLSQFDLDRFWKKVDKTGGTEECWEWLASKKPGKYNYGQFRLNGVTNFAHIASFIIENGYKPPKGKQIFHICKNYWCVNPKHLVELDHLTRLSRVEGWQARENSKKTHCPKGHPLVKGNLDETMLKNHGWRQCLICQIEKTKRYNDPEYYKNPELKGKQKAWRQDPKVKAAKKQYDKERHLRLKEFLKRIIEVNAEESLTVGDDEIKGTPEDWFNELITYNNIRDPYKISSTPKKIRIESKRQKKLIAAIEHYTCQLCGWSLECKNSKGRIVHRIDIDHIVEKNDGGTEEASNLWALCPNCHVKKTVGVIMVDLVKKKITENGKERRLLSDSHLRWY